MQWWSGAGDAKPKSSSKLSQDRCGVHLPDFEDNEIAALPVVVHSDIGQSKTST